MSLLELLEKEASTPQNVPEKAAGMFAYYSSSDSAFNVSNFLSSIHTRLESSPSPAKVPGLVPRALLNRPKAKPSVAKSGQSISSGTSKPIQTRPTSSITPNSQAQLASNNPSIPPAAINNVAEDLVGLANLADLYHPGKPTNFYISVYQPQLDRLSSSNAEIEAENRTSNSVAQIASTGPSIGETMLFKQGWKGEGHGLGKDGKGIATPLIALGVDSGTSRPTGTILRAHPMSKQSRVVVFLNMVSRGRADEALLQETKEDCSSFGIVISCFACESPDPTCNENECVRIFVHFEDSDAAHRAKKTFHNRKFDDRVVRTAFYPESALQANKLWLPLQID